GMATREETPLDQEVYDKTLADELAKGTDRRVADGRAKSAAVRAYRKSHPEAEAEHQARARTPAAAAPAAEGAGDGDGGAAAPAAAAAAVATAPAGMVAYAPPPAAAVRTAPPPTGRAPVAKPGQPDKHRLLALVPPEGVQRVEREQGDRVNTFPHLLIEEFVALLAVTVAVVVFSTFVQAPLRELANPNLTPNPP